MDTHLPEMSMTEIVGYMLSGLGLFFTGLNLISGHLRQMTGRRLQELFSRFASRPLIAGFWGFVLGGVTQSDTAVAFLSMNLLRNRLLILRQAMIIMAWSSVGTSLLVFFTTFPLNTMVTYLLGVAGILYAIEGNWKLRPVVGLVFGLAMIFFGLLLLEDYAGKMQAFDWFKHLLEETSGHYVAAFCIGIFLTVVSQSSSAVSVVAIVLAKTGILHPPETLMIIYGTNVGSAAGLWLLAFRERGVAKRLAMFEVLFNVIGSVVLVPLFYIEVLSNYKIPLVLSVLEHTGRPLNQQMAVAYLLFNLTGAILVIPLLSFLNRWLEKRYPEDAEDQASRVQYLHPRATREPASCLPLIVDEQNRLIQRLVQYFVEIPDAGRRTAASDRLYETSEALEHEIDPYLKELISSNLESQLAGRLARLVERQRLIESLQREYHRVVPFIMDAAVAGDKFALRLREGFEATTDLVVGALCDLQPVDLEMAAAVTRDGGDAIRRVQEAFMETAEKARTAEEQARLLQMTTGLERLVWLLHSATRNACALAGMESSA